MQKRELRRAVFGDESCIGRLPWLNTAVLVYVGVTVVSFVLLQIAPVLTWMAKTPLYHISTYLGLIGAVLMALRQLSPGAGQKARRGWMDTLARTLAGKEVA